MVETRPDPIRVPTINMSLEELEQMQALMDKGELPPDFIDRHFDAVDANVFGADAPKDRHGNRTEQGRGSPVNMTQQSIDAYKRWCGPNKDRPEGEPGFAENLKKMEAQLAANLKKNPIDTREQWRRRKGRKAAR